MSERALKEHRDVRTQKEYANDARRIRTKVEAARGPGRAEVRWPFELVQNAHDSGPRDKGNFVEIKFLQENERLVVSHNGKPFDDLELYALLTGGSSKEFEGGETTGRFGTGFLITHGLSRRVDVEGILETEEGPEGFCIKLDRAGDEEAIIKNIGSADEALLAARHLSASEIADRPTASFTYYDADLAVAEKGLDRLENTIAYLYATCDKLGQIRIERPHKTIIFEPEAMAEIEVDGFLLKKIDVSVSQGETTRWLTALRIVSQDVQSGLLVVLDATNDQQNRVILPDSTFSKIFVKFPIAETGFLPFNVVLDGPFAPRQERDGIEMNASDKQLIQEALSAFPSLMQYAVESGWQNAHAIARLAVPERLLSGDDNSTGELEWWQEVISEIAAATAKRSIIATESGFLPALSEDDETVSFLVPALDVSSQVKVDAEVVYGLAARVTSLQLPIQAIAQDWEQIALEWNNLDLSVDRLGLTELTDRLREDCHSITDLPINGDPFNWLADLLLLVADLPEGADPRPLLNRLVPDQHCRLRRPQDLRVDEGISDEVKDIADAIGVDIRSQLLHNDLVTTLSEPGYESAKACIYELMSQPYTESEAVDQVLKSLDEKLPEDKVFLEYVDVLYLRASARLVAYLAGQDSDIQSLRKCPLLNAADAIARLPNNLQILAPVSHWPESARPYADLYTKNRILSDRYVDDTELNEALQPFIDRNLVVPAPLYRAPRPELDGDLLKAMVPIGTETDGMTVRNQSFGQIAFLASEVVNRCGRDQSHATLLLDFVLNVAAQEDENWSESSLINGYRDREPLPLHIYGSTWPFELKVRSWVPVPLEDKETFAPAPANEANLRELLDSNWLQNNPRAIELLHRVFGFRQLTLMLENSDYEVENDLVQLLQDPGLVKSAVANLDVVRTAIENPEAVRIFSEAGADEIQKIREEIDERNRQAAVRKLNDNFGHAVQAAVKAAVESLGLNLKLVDWGYDYEVFPDGASFSFEVGSYFLEVKATTTRDVGLTPTQAQTACKHPDRFVLCVVDLAGFPGARYKENWQAGDVAPHAKIITNIGDKFQEIYEGVAEFAYYGNPVRLRNEHLLRYGVSTELWQNSISIDAWVKSLRV